MILLLLALGTAATAQVTASGAKRTAYEAVVGFEGKPIGTNILLEIAQDGAVSGWIQRNNYFPIDSGQADAEHIKFTSGGNQYDINLRTERISYSGPDGDGNQRVQKMRYVSGLIYRLVEPGVEDDPTEITIRGDEGERDYLIGTPAVWKNTGPPIDEIDYEHFKPIVGKTTGFYLIGRRLITVLEEPAGMDLQKKTPKQKKEKKKK